MQLCLTFTKVGGSVREVVLDITDAAPRINEMLKSGWFLSEITVPHSVKMLNIS